MPIRREPYRRARATARAAARFPVRRGVDGRTTLLRDPDVSRQALRLALQPLDNANPWRQIGVFGAGVFRPQFAAPSLYAGEVRRVISRHFADRCELVSVERLDSDLDGVLVVRVAVRWFDSQQVESSTLRLVATA